MYPVLYAATETAFTSNGIGMLRECTSCTVTEERNGIYECEFTVAVTDKHYADIDIGKIVFAPHDDSNDRQPFVIYRKTTPINGMVTFNAHHISYWLSNVIIPPMEHSGVADTFEAFEDDALTGNPFSFFTTKSSAGTFKTSVPVSIKSVLWGTEGSVLDVFGGGEYEFDKFTVKLYQHRGADTGVTIRYAKNLSDIEQEVDAGEIYNAVIPYWYDSESGTLVQGDLVKGTDSGTETKAITLDLSDEFEAQPTTAQLEARALTLLDTNTPWVPKENITIDFVALWQTEEYKDVASLERVKLCDTVSVFYPAAGVTAKAKVIRVVYDVLAERYSEIEIGDARSSYADVIVGDLEEKTIAQVAKGISTMEQALDHATQLITGGLGGHLVIGTDANGKPQEIFLMDTESVGTAMQVLRINVNGIGFSSNGINGPYDTAWTLDGVFSANYITTGYLACDRIKGGTLVLGGSDNGNGYVKLYDATGAQIAKIDRDCFVLSTVHTDPSYVGGQSILNTIFPADTNASMQVLNLETGQWVTDNLTDVIRASHETYTKQETVTNYSGKATLYKPGGQVEYNVDMTFPTANDEITVVKNVRHLTNGERIENFEEHHYTGEYVIDTPGPDYGWRYVLDSKVQTSKRAELSPTRLKLSSEQDNPDSPGGVYYKGNSVLVDLENHQVDISGSDKWTLTVNNKPLRESWEYLGVKTGTAELSYTQYNYTEIYVTVQITSGNYVTFFCPTGAINSTWYLCNYYGATNDGFCRIKVGQNVVGIVSVYNGNTDVTNSAIMYVYGR